MRILQINAVYGIYSTGVSTAELHEYLLDHGHQSYVASAFGGEGAYKIGGNFGKKAHAMLARLTGRQAAFSSHSTKKLLEYIDKIQPNAVILQNLHSNFVNLKMLLSYLAKNDIPTIAVLHDCWFYTGNCVHYTKNGCYKWQTGCENCKFLDSGMKTWLFDRTKTMYAEKKQGFSEIPRLAVIGVSDWITAEAKRSLLANATIIKRIYNWVDTDVFCPCKSEKNEVFTLLGVASDWSESKGLSSIIELAEAMPDINIMLAGRIQKTELPTNIKCLGMIKSKSELAKLYSKSDAFISLSPEESFGKACAEALACGTPIIVGNKTASPELAQNGCGIVVDFKDIKTVIAAVNEIKSKGKAAYSQNCRDTALVRFSKNERIEDYISLIYALCEY